MISASVIIIQDWNEETIVQNRFTDICCFSCVRQWNDYKNNG